MTISTAALFPFTFISEKWARACGSAFGPLVVYQPAAEATPAVMRTLSEQGLIRMRVPVQGDDVRLAEMVRQYQQWGGVHHKHAAALKPFAESGFYNQEFVPEIRTEILKGGSEPETDPDPVFTARLFLLMAQEYDRQAAELANQLAASDDAARQMFARIHGGPFGTGKDGKSNELKELSAGTAGGRAPVPEDPGAYMTGARIRAWQYLAESDPNMPTIWVTSSAAVVSAFQEHFEPLVRLAQMPETVRAGLEKQGEAVSDTGAAFYEMPASGRVIGFLPHAGAADKNSDHGP